MKRDNFTILLDWLILAVMLAAFVTLAAVADAFGQNECAAANPGWVAVERYSSVTGVIHDTKCLDSNGRTWTTTFTGHSFGATTNPLIPWVWPSVPHLGADAGDDILQWGVNFDPVTGLSPTVAGEATIQFALEHDYDNGAPEHQWEYYLSYKPGGSAVGRNVFMWYGQAHTASATPKWGAYLDVGSNNNDAFTLKKGGTVRTDFLQRANVQQTIYPNTAARYFLQETDSVDYTYSYDSTTVDATNGPWLNWTIGNCAGCLQLFGNGPMQGARTMRLTLLTLAAYTCDVDHRGQFNYIAGGAGVKDIVQVCAKDAANAYAWRAIY